MTTQSLRPLTCPDRGRIHPLHHILAIARQGPYSSALGPGQGTSLWLSSQARLDGTRGTIMASLKLKRIRLSDEAATQHLSSLRHQLSQDGEVISQRGPALTETVFGEAL